MKHICLFSGGASSAYMSYLVAQEHGKDTILLHTPTGAEHPTADIFRQRVAEKIGLPITEAGCGETLWELIGWKKCLPSQFIPWCTQVLKHIPAEKFYKGIGDDFILYIGYGPDEERRLQKQTARFEVAGYKVKYPMFDRKITSEEAKRIIRDKWGICLPDPYKYIKHNNCLPCFKGGESHFYKVWKFYPEYFKKAIEAEELTNHTVFKTHSLKELATIWAKNESIDLFDADESIPCLCAV